MKKRNAFTLAEVLITLGIIGIVAAMTLPTIVTKYRKQVVETKLKKNFSLLNTWVKRVIVDYGEPSEWPSMSSSEFVKIYMIPYFPGSKFISESTLSNYKVTTYNNKDTVQLNGGYASGVKLKTGEILRVVNGVNSNTQYIQIGIIINDKHDKTSFIFEKDYFTTILDKKTGLIDNNNLYNCKTDKSLLIERCGSYGHDPACFKLIQCNNWKIPDYYPIKF